MVEPAVACIADLFSSSQMDNREVLVEGELVDAAPLEGRHALVRGWELTFRTEERDKVVLVVTLNEASLFIGYPYRFRGVQVNRTPEIKRKVRGLPGTYFQLAPCEKLVQLGSK